VFNIQYIFSTSQIISEIKNGETTNHEQILMSWTKSVSCIHEVKVLMLVFQCLLHVHDDTTTVFEHPTYVIYEWAIVA